MDSNSLRYRDAFARMNGNRRSIGRGTCSPRVITGVEIVVDGGMKV